MRAEEDAAYSGGGTVRERFERRLVKARGKHADAACWSYRGSHTHGVGSFRVASDCTWPAPRTSWSLANGPWVPSMTLEHLCGQKWCCNPRHIRLARRPRTAVRTRCRYTARQKAERIALCAALGIEETARTTNTRVATLERWLRDHRKTLNGASYAHEGADAR